MSRLSWNRIRASAARFASTWCEWLAGGLDPDTESSYAWPPTLGAPSASQAFIDRLEAATSGTLAPQKLGRKPIIAMAEDNLQDLFARENSNWSTVPAFCPAF